jgi:hypothetical protein
MSRLADALEKAAFGVSTIGGKQLENRPDWIGDMGARNVDTGGQPPQQPESQLVGSFDGIVVIPAANPEPEPYSDKWPPSDPTIAKAISEALLPSRRKDAT